MFTQTVEYAMSGMAQLAAHASEFQTADDIAKVTGASAMYLNKVFRQMREAGLVVTRHGRFGGFKLARPPVRISLLEIIDAIDPFKRGEGVCRAKEMSPLNRKVDESVSDTRKRLASIKLADVVARKR